MAVLACGDVAVILRMAVDTAEGSVFFRAVDQCGIRTLMTSGTDDIFHLFAVLDIYRRMRWMTPDTATVVFEGYVGLGMALGAVRNVAMPGVVAAAATKLRMRTGI